MEQSRGAWGGGAAVARLTGDGGGAPADVLRQPGNGAVRGGSTEGQEQQGHGVSRLRQGGQPAIPAPGVGGETATRKADRLNAARAQD